MVTSIVYLTAMLLVGAIFSIWMTKHDHLEVM